MPHDNASRRKAFLDNFTEPQAARAFMLHFVTHPFYITACLFPMVLRATGMVPLEFPHLGLAWDLAYYCLRIVIYSAILVWAAPWWYLGGLKRNIPFVIVHHGGFLALTFVSWLVTLTTMDTGLSWHDIAVKVVRHQTFAIVITLLITLHFGPEIRRCFGINPDWVPIWQRCTMPHSAVVWANVIDPALRGQLLAIRTQNQYILVETDLKTTLLRRSLASAINLLAASDGVLVHRTAWVSNTVLAQARISRDGGKLLIDGQSYPIGRGRKAAVQSAIDALQHLSSASSTQITPTKVGTAASV